MRPGDIGVVKLLDVLFIFEIAKIDWIPGGYKTFPVIGTCFVLVGKRQGVPIPTWERYDKEWFTADVCEPTEELLRMYETFNGV